MTIITPRKRPFTVRHHRKADGRSLWLYGRVPHVAEPLDEIVGYEPGGAHLRFHPLRREWLVVSPRRQSRTFAPTGGDNPLAAASPGGAPTEIPFADFEVAVFQNRFPGLSAEAESAHEVPWQTAPAIGACEVVVYTTDPTASMGTLEDGRRVLLLEALADRCRHHLEQGARFVLPFENRGPEVGATLHHPHGQIYAFPFVPGPQTAVAQALPTGMTCRANSIAGARGRGWSRAGTPRASCRLSPGSPTKAGSRRLPGAPALPR